MLFYRHIYHHHLPFSYILTLGACLVCGEIHQKSDLFFRGDVESKLSCRNPTKQKLHPHGSVAFVISVIEYRSFSISQFACILYFLKSQVNPLFPFLNSLFSIIPIPPFLQHSPCMRSSSHFLQVPSACHYC